MKYRKNVTDIYGAVLVLFHLVRSILLIVLALVQVSGAMFSAGKYYEMAFGANTSDDSIVLKQLKIASYAHFVEYGKLPVSVSELNEKYDLKLPLLNGNGKEYRIDIDKYEVFIRGVIGTDRLNKSEVSR